MSIKDVNMEEIPLKTVRSVIYRLQKEGYCVKSSFKYPKKIPAAIPIRFGNYIPHIFAYKGMNDFIIVEFETCGNILSPKNENKWRALSSKSGLAVHLIVPLGCKEKAELKSKIKNIPVKIHCMNHWEDSFNLEASK